MSNKINMIFSTNKNNIVRKGTTPKLHSILSSNIGNVKLNNLRSIYTHKGGSCG
jgi:hypothetical protein